MDKKEALVLWFDQLHRGDVALVGGKNASLGELLVGLAEQHIPVPPGFATTARCYREFVEANQLQALIGTTLEKRARGELGLAAAGKLVRQAFLQADWPPHLSREIAAAYTRLGEQAGSRDIAVAVRSSATAEDLPDASFAGQQESFLNISGEAALLDACRRCLASLFTDRAISYREAKGFDHLQVALSIGVQVMVRSDLASAGVMFTIDTETGFEDVVVINAAWGLGENIVQGKVDPDEYQVFKPLLTTGSFAPIIGKKRGLKEQMLIYGDTPQNPTRNVDVPEEQRLAFTLDEADILLLAKWACLIEQHYGCPMDIEWARDGNTNKLYVVQARPETVQSQKKNSSLQSYRIAGDRKCLLSGIAVGQSIVAAPVCLIHDISEIDRFVDGSVLVTENTNPDWVPIMKRAAAIVTDHGGRTSHAAIVSRELGVPAVIGTGSATGTLRDAQEVTVSCAEGDNGFVYEGAVEFEREEIDLGSLPQTRTKVMLNLANPAACMQWWNLPADGVGLARMEFIISDHIRVHPMALVNFAAIEDPAVQQWILDLTVGYEDKTDYFVDRLALGLSRIAAVRYPHPVIIRLSDFKTNEYANLVGGRQFEPDEENPMLGFRGASRYYSPRYREGFALECKAIRRLRERMGFKNVIVMVPFCRTVEEADQVLATMGDYGLVRGSDGLELYMMCEIPSNVVQAADFAKRFDGYSIGSNDLTQLTLGIDRDSAALATLFDEKNASVLWMIEHAIKEAHRAGIHIGLCGQAPSDYPDFAEFLVRCGIDAISVTPDSFCAVKRQIAQTEQKLDGG